MVRGLTARETLVDEESLRQCIRPVCGEDFLAMMRFARPWRISTKEFREDLECAVIVPGTSEISPAVAQLLDELSERGIIIHDSSFDSW